MAEITLKSIAHSYSASPGSGDYVLRDVDLKWRDGGAYALLGPSGCGKTTLLNLMSGLLRPTRGQILYGDRDVTDLDPRARNIAQVFQFPVIYNTFTVFENLAFPLRNRGMRGSDVTRRVERVAEMLELGSLLKQDASDLTADTKQLVSLGRGLVRDDVAAILFDEPLTVIDPHRKWTLRRKLREIHREFRHTLVYVTHDQTEALTFADEVVVMHEGRVLQQATPEELFANPAHTYVGYFIGSPGMNVLPCRIEDGGAVIAGHRVPLPAELAARAAGRAGTLELGIRPEHLVLGPPEGGVPATIVFVEDHGRFQIASATLGEGATKDAAPDGAKAAIKLKLPPGAPVAAGQTCRLGLPPERVRLYEDGRAILGTSPATTPTTSPATTPATTTAAGTGD
ncbi:MAG TPA: ABC transporter ATP-binding protein [Kofleriaceae bacterium]|nr:ABC transporter ATP-binding protein [Kofleriaceae bacterium]